MFSQMIDQMEQKNKWQKFESQTWCYKPLPTVEGLRTPTYDSTEVIVDPLSFPLLFLKFVNCVHVTFYSMFLLFIFYQNYFLYIHLDFQFWFNFSSSNFQIRQAVYVLRWCITRITFYIFILIFGFGLIVIFLLQN